MKNILLSTLLCPLFTCATAWLHAEESPKLRNLPAREEEFMDWGVGMFVHWSVDVALGSVISHSLVGASQDYMDR